MSGRGVTAVVPIKGFADAKQRLAPAHDAAFRQGLARAMCADVLAVLADVRGIAALVVSTLDREAATLARAFGARIIEDGADEGHTGAVTAAARILTNEGASGVVTVPGDIPCVTVAELARLLAAHGETPAFTIAPARDRRGSNAIVMSPPGAVPLAFGDDSFHPHLAAARRHGIEPLVIDLPGIGLDIDTPEDVAALRRARPGPRTAAFLSERPPRASCAPGRQT